MTIVTQECNGIWVSLDSKGNVSGAKRINMVVTRLVIDDRQLSW